MSKLVRLRSFFVPALIGSILCCAFGYYYLYWVPSRQRYLDDRSFRVLKTLSDQIRLSINTFDKMLDNAADNGISGDSMGDYLKAVAPQLQIPEEDESDPVVGQDYSDPPKIAVEADEGTHFLYLAFQRGSKASKRSSPAKYVIRTDLDKMIDRLAPQRSLNPFDVLLVAQSDGIIIFQRSVSGIEVARIKTIEDASGETKGKPHKPITADLLSQASRLEEVKFAGARYRLYSQPLQISFFPAKGGPMSGVPPPWVLCGLVRADRFRSESQSIPYAYILGILAAILLVVAAYPFLRLLLSSPAERLRTVDLIATAVFTCFVAAALTLILSDLYYWQIAFGPAADDDMGRLARAIDSNFAHETNLAFAQLDALNRSPDLLAALQQVSVDPDSTPPQLTEGGKCNPSWACRIEILRNPPRGAKASPDEEVKLLEYEYPYLAHVYWSDYQGVQRVKWSTGERITPFISLDDPSVTYYPDVKRAVRNPGGPINSSGIGSQYSPNTGENITIFWKLLAIDEHGKEVPIDEYWNQEPQKSEERKVFSASLVTRPVSVIGSVLPSGFQFAVLEPDGTVVFHSDPTRNLRENFFAETDQNLDLRSRVKMRAAGSIITNYMGRPHRFYVQPMARNEEAGVDQGGLWTVVVFRDLHLEETKNLEMLTLISIMVFLYAGVIALVLVVVYWARKGQASRIWLWPDSRKARSYGPVAIANIVAAMLLLIFSSFVSPLALVSCVVVIPLGTILLNLVILRGRSDAKGSADGTDDEMSSRCKLGYFGASATMLVVVAVLPCLSLFKVAGDFEHKLFIERTQLLFAADIHNRALRVRERYQNINLGKDGEVQKKVLAGPEGQHAEKLLNASTDTTAAVYSHELLDKVCPKAEDQQAKQLPDPVFSYHEILDTKVCAEEARTDRNDSSPTKLDCGAVGAPSCVESFLSAISLPYNELAADDRYLSEATQSDMWRWVSSSSGRREQLELTSNEPGKKSRKIVSVWTPFHFPWTQWKWSLGTVAFLVALFLLVRVSLSRIFLLNLVAPAVVKNLAFGLSPASLMAELPMNLLIIGPESCLPVADLIRRPEVQARDTEALLAPKATIAASGGGSETTTFTGDQVDQIVRDGRHLALRNFDRALDDVEASSKCIGILRRVLSGLGNSIIIISEVDPLSEPSVEASEQWRTLLRSFVRIDLNSRPAQRIDEEDADYEARVSADAYYRWLLCGLSKPQKLVMVQLAQEKLINPNSRDSVSELISQGMIERRWGLLAVADDGFAEFLKDAIPHNTVKRWERQGAGARPASLQTSLLVLGVGVVGFLIYTQGEVFNTWVTYATGFAASLPKALQFLESFRQKNGAKT